MIFELPRIKPRKNLNGIKMKHNKAMTCIKYFFILMLLTNATLLFSQINAIELNEEDLDFPELNESLYLDVSNTHQLSQIGNDNTNETEQRGFSNEIKTLQKGNQNQLFFEQRGNLQRTLFIQKGNQNYFEGNIDGVENNLSVFQIGDMNSIQADFQDFSESDLLLYQKGNKNEMDLLKVGENNMDLQIFQRGSDMKLKIIEY